MCCVRPSVLSRVSPMLRFASRAIRPHPSEIWKRRTDATYFGAHSLRVRPNVADPQVILERDTGRSRGFGFITYGNEQEAQVALGEC